MRKKCRLFRLQGQRVRYLFCALLLVPLFVAAIPLPDGVTANEAMEQPGRRISGIVYDTDGNSLPGVNVRVQGTSIGTNTDANGQFTLNVSEGAILEITYIGYVTLTVAAIDNLRITLEESSQALDEVIVVGYGTIKKSDLTGAVASVTPKAFIDQPSSGGVSILAGRAPGLVVRRTNGAPGEESTLRIRGVNSILGNNDPLIVVDGNYSGMPNMYDIESIEILKDATATAIYGSRGANGVIIVTTKRGTSEGRNEVKLYTNFSFDHIPQNWRYDMMDAMEYVNFTNDFYMSAGENPLYGPDAIALYSTMGKGTNWQNELFRTGISQNHKVVFSGGNNKMKYYISPSFSQTEGVIINSWSKSYSLGTKFDAELNKHLSYQIEAGISHGDRWNPDLGRGTSHEFMPLCAALAWSPISRVYNDEGDFQVSDPLSARVVNPVLITTQKDTRYSNNGNAIGNIKITIIDGLTLDGKASMSFGTGGNRYYRPGAMYRDDAYQSSYETKTWLVNSFLTYVKTFEEKHNMSIMLGYEETWSNSRNFLARANDLMVVSSEWDDLSLGKQFEMSSGYSNNAMQSFFARATYNYDARYYFTGTFRADGSSKFREGNRFSYFPSFGVSWRLSEEGFLKDTEIFQNLKLRGTWGVTGSQAVGAYATYSPMGRRSYTWGTGQAFSGYEPGSPSNPNLQWEETTSTDFGLDVSVLGGKLSISFDYYYKQTDKLLSRTTVPIYNGGGTISTNIGTLENKGFEVNINYTVFENSNWSYDVNLNGSLNRNKVLDIGDQERLWGGSSVAGAMPQSPFIILPGYPIGTIYGYKYLGIWQLGDVVEAHKYGQEPGHYRYEDIDGNYNYDAGDYQVIGCASPKFTWGFNNHLSWKNWDLNVLVEGLHGRDILNLTYLTTTNMFDNSMTIKARAGKDRWSPDNPYAKFSKASISNIINSNSDQWIQDGSYVKIRNISLAYRLSKKMTRIADMRLGVSAQNIFRFTKYKGYDPEVSSASGSDTDAGLDWFAYPNPRSFSASLSVEF